MRALVKGSLSATLALFLLSGCAGMTVSRPAYVSSIYGIETLQGPAAQGGALLEVVGNPFPIPQASLDRTVARLIEANHFGPDFPVLTEAPADRTLAYRIVVVFDPAPPASADAACTVKEQPRLASPGSRTGMLAAFCEYRQRMTSTIAQGGPFTGPDDPGFQAMVKQVAHSIFPPIRGDSNLSGDGPDFFP